MKIIRFIGLLLLLFSLPVFLMGQGHIRHYSSEEQIDNQVNILVSDSLLSLVEQVSPRSYFDKNVIPLQHYPALAEKMLTFLENNGYPFAEVSIVQVADSLFYLQLNKNQYVTYDSTIVKGDLKLRRGFLQPFLAWKPGRKYCERAASQIADKIKSLSFAAETSPSGIEFVDDKAYLYLFLQRQKVNQFDGYIGIVPVSDNSGKTLVSGELNLHLQNIFALGESLDLVWKAPERYSQYLFIQADFPYIFRLPLGVKGSFVLDKKDTTYLNMNYLAALKYSFQGTNYLQLYYNYFNSRVLSNDVLSYVSSDSLFCDFNKSIYGISLIYRQLDDYIQPRKGFALFADMSVGVRKIVRNAAVESIFYDGLSLNSVIYRLNFEGDGYVPFGKRWGMALCLNGLWQSGRATLFNELYKFGGASTLQGFDEMSLLASSYLMANAELRFWFAKYSYINAFVNGAWYERKMESSYFADYPFGFGLGITLYTKAGIFYLNYALGQQKNSPLSFKNGKIHFGIKVQF